VAYLDGHVKLFSDYDRRITFWIGQTRYYGTSYALPGYDAGG
jgi:hypothetical protein